MRRILPIPCALLVAALASTAHATALLPGQTITLTGANAPAGTVLDQSIQSLNFAQATLTSTVLRDASTGKLDFLYTVNGDLAQTPLTLGITGFAGTTTNVEFVGASGDLLPGQASRSLDAETISFDGWNSPAAFMVALFVQTDADNYQLGNYHILFPGEGIPRIDLEPVDTSIDVNLPVFTPSAPVPEPSSLALLPLAVAALVTRFRKLA